MMDWGIPTGLENSKQFSVTACSAPDRQPWRMRLGSYMKKAQNMK